MGRLFEALFSLLVGGFSDAMSKDGRDDPVYRKNLQRLIERNRQPEEERNKRRS